MPTLQIGDHVRLLRSITGERETKVRSGYKRKSHKTVRMPQRIRFGTYATITAIGPAGVTVRAGDTTAICPTTDLDKACPRGIAWMQKHGIIESVLPKAILMRYPDDELERRQPQAA